MFEIFSNMLLAKKPKAILMRYIFLCLIVVVLAQACIVIDNPYTAIPPGEWRAVLKLDGNDPTIPDPNNPLFVEVAAGELPFTFEVIYDDEENYHIEIINAEERIRVDDIQFGHNKQSGRDTILIDFPVYESYVRAFYEEDVIEGEWVVKTRKDYSIPFVAFHGQDYRFTELRKTPKLDLSGNWEVTFGTDTDDPYKAIGEFQQAGNNLSGTFRTETGDYRFLEGEVQADKVYLSCFDGSHAFLFEAKILEDERMIGSFRSGNHYRTTWEAKRNPDFVLGSPDSLTYLKEGYDALSFAFENPDGKLISLDNEDLKDKVKIVQIFGTWCPNCRDEANFLVDYLQQNNPSNLEVIGLAFEKHRDKAKANVAIKTYKEKMKIPYEMVVAGYYNKKEAAEALPMLNAIISYPTMIFVDKNNQVRRIHTGFSGPATSQYKDFAQDFDDFVKELLAE